MAMAKTMNDIAQLAGVSRGTVDRAINGRGRIDKEVEARILQIAEEIGYVPRKKRKEMESVSVVQRRKLGVILQLEKASFMLEVKRGIYDATELLKARGIDILLRACDKVDENAQREAILELEQDGIEGLAIMPVDSDSIREELLRLSNEKSMPIVTFNSDIVGTKRNCFVGLDNWKSGQTAAGLMAYMTGKKGKILIITGYFSNSVSSKRVDGFLEEMRTTFPNMELLGVQCSYDKEEEVEQIIVNMMSFVPDLAGIFVASGGQAGVRKAFEQLRLNQRPFVIIYDLTPKNERALREGSVDFLIDQQGYEQGFRSLMVLSDLVLKEEEVKEEFLYTDIRIKTKYNI